MHASLRAAYNHARKTSVSSLPKAWMNDPAALDTPVRREFHLFLPLSGSRSDALKRAQFDQIDFHARVLHMPKAFDIPLSRAMILCLARVLRLGRLLYPTQERDWVFPADSTSGNLAEYKEDRRMLAKWGNDLRQTYRTDLEARLDEDQVGTFALCGGRWHCGVHAEFPRFVACGGDNAALARSAGQQ